MYISKIKELEAKKNYLVASINYHFIGMFQGWQNGYPTDLLPKEELGLNSHYYAAIKKQFDAEKTAYIICRKELQALYDEQINRSTEEATPKVEEPKAIVVVESGKPSLSNDLPFNHPRIKETPEKKEAPKTKKGDENNAKRYIVSIEGKKFMVNREQWLKLQMANEASRKSAFKHRLKWDPDDDELLIKMWNLGISTPEIAKALGRTLLAVKDRVSILVENGELKNRGRNHK